MDSLWRQLCLGGQNSIKEQDAAWTDRLVGKAGFVVGLELHCITPLIEEDTEHTALHPGKPPSHKLLSPPDTLRRTCAYSISIMCIFMCLHFHMLCLL